jgi:hypothetical protein
MDLMPPSSRKKINSVVEKIILALWNFRLTLGLRASQEEQAVLKMRGGRCSVNVNERKKYEEGRWV